MHIQVGAQTETELNEKTLRVEHALNATKVKVLFDKTLFKTKDFFYLLPTLIFH